MEAARYPCSDTHFLRLFETGWERREGTPQQEAARAAVNEEAR